MTSVLYVDILKNRGAYYHGAVVALVSILPWGFCIKIILTITVDLIFLLLSSLPLLINVHVWPMNPLLKKQIR